MKPEDSLSANGYAVIEFGNVGLLYEIQKIVSAHFPCVPTDYHHESADDEQRLNLVKITRDKIVESGLIKQFLLANSEELVRLLGPDIDVQSDVYLRVSRPNLEKDFIDWHRDTFYGNSYWELNMWFPIFSLDVGAGLMVVEGSHLESAKNVQSIQDKDTFRSTVTKGSLANELGYLYAPKSDDTISNLDISRVRLLTPNVGQAVLFFTHLAHRAHNTSSITRVTVDLRVRSMLAPTNTKAGYYMPLTRGTIANCVEKMIELNR